MKYGFFGAGKMAEGILQALLGGDVRPDEIVLAEKNEARAAEMAQRYQTKVVADAKEVAEKADIVFLAVRPQDVASVAEAVEGLLDETKLLVSIVAGHTIANLEHGFGERVRLIRVMPNLALRVKAGMCAICGAKTATRDDVDTVARLLALAGEVVELEERHFDAVTALSGSGPAFYAAMELAMVEGGERLGLPGDVSRLLAEQTMLGTVRTIMENKLDLARFIDSVATKGGTTAAGMDVLSQSDFKAIVADTLAAAARRSQELRG